MARLHSKYVALLVSTSLCLSVAGAAFAEEMGGADILSPQRPWSVEAGVLAAADGPGIPYCSISNSYKNDARLEFYGTSGALAAVKIDLPGSALKAGASYEVSLSIPGAYKTDMIGIAVDGKTLMINVLEDEALPAALHHGTILYVGFEASYFAFSLSGINNFTARMQGCQGAGAVQTAVSAAPAPEEQVDAPALEALDTVPPVVEREAAAAPVAINPYPAGYENEEEKSLEALHRGAGRSGFVTRAAEAPVNLDEKPASFASENGHVKQAWNSAEQGRIEEELRQPQRLRMVPSLDESVQPDMPEGMHAEFAQKTLAEGQAGDVSVQAAPVAAVEVDADTVVAAAEIPAEISAPDAVPEESQPDADVAQVFMPAEAEDPESPPVEPQAAVVEDVPEEAVEEQPSQQDVDVAAVEPEPAKLVRIPVMPEGEEAMPSQEDLSAHITSQEPQRWQAVKGASIEGVLKLWSNDHGVDLVWNAGDDFKVRETVSLKTSYEAAVESLLQQYDDVSDGVLRPVGQLHIDPETGKKILLVKSERS